MIDKTVLHYKILEKLGEGGMGVVYKAKDIKLKRDVALKFLPTNALQGPDEKDRFTREAQAAAALNHANIAHIYAIEEHDGQMFIAMEYIEGQSLEDVLGRGEVTSPLPLDDAIDYASQIAAGRLPFRGDYEQAVIYSILNEEPEPLTALHADENSNKRNKIL